MRIIIIILIFGALFLSDRSLVFAAPMMVAKEQAIFLAFKITSFATFNPSIFLVLRMSPAGRSSPVLPL